VHYPIPVHRQKAYEHLGYQEGSFPIAETTAAEILSLPMFPELTSGQIDLVAEAVQSTASLAAQPAFIAVKRQVRGPLAARVASLAASGDDPFLDSFG